MKIEIVESSIKHFFCKEKSAVENVFYVINSSNPVLKYTAFSK